MQVQFKNVLFDLDSFRFAAVNETVLTIVLNDGELDLDFETEDEALTAQAELGDLINSKKAETVSFTDLIQEASTVVNSVLGSIGGFGGFGSLTKAFSDAKATVKSKVDEVTKTVTDIDISEVESRVEKLMDEMEKAINKSKTKTPDMGYGSQSPKSTAQSFEDVFGASADVSERKSKTKKEVDLSNSPTSDLSDTELKQVISDKCDSLIESDVRVKSLLDNLRTYHSDADVESVIQAHKDQVFVIARANPGLTVSQVFANILR